MRRPTGSSAEVGSSSSEHARLADERLRDPEPLLHALRHAVDPAVARRRRARRARAAGRARRRRRREPASRWCSSSTSSAVYQPGKRKSSARYPSSARAARLPARAPATSAWPRVGTHEPDCDLHERRLAGAVRAEQSDELALPHLEVDAPERLDGPVALLQRVDGEGGRHATRVRHYAPRMPRGYMEGPAAEEAERRAEEAARETGRAAGAGAPRGGVRLHGGRSRAALPRLARRGRSRRAVRDRRRLGRHGPPRRRRALATGLSRRTRRSTARAASGSSSSRGPRARPRPWRSSRCRVPRRR